jgi:hypothetical protein
VLSRAGVYQRKHSGKKERRRHGEFRGFILLALLKKGPLSLENLERLASILATRFEIVGVELGTRIVSGFFSKLGRPATVRSSKSKNKIDEPDVKWSIGSPSTLAPWRRPLSV